MILTPGELEAIERQAVEEYPAECCGVVVVRGAERRLLRFRNVQDELHARNPTQYPRTARTAYRASAEDLKRLGDLERAGFDVAVVYHSHIDAGAYFSETDRREAMMGLDPARHDPIYPDAAYVVVSVVARAVAAVAAFRWDRARRDFVAVDLDRDALRAGTAPAPEVRP